MTGIENLEASIKRLKKGLICLEEKTHVNPYGSWKQCSSYNSIEGRASGGTIIISMNSINGDKDLMEKCRVLSIEIMQAQLVEAQDKLRAEIHHLLDV